MESASHRLQEEQRKQDEIRKQIALLQAQLVELPDEEQSPVAGVKRKQGHTHNANSRGSPSVLAPASPSPKKKRKLEIARDVSKHTERRNAAPSASSTKPTILGKGQVAKPNVPAPSTFLNRLAALTNDECHDAEEKRDKPSRSASFTDAAPSIHHDHARPKRNEDLTIVDDMEPGPYEHNPPLDDPNFDRLEPHSGIRLLSRAIPHDDISEYMHGRFYLSPSRLYSCVRLSADKQSYDVPVSGDWVTIAVVAEIGEVKYTRAPVSLERDEDEKKKSGNRNKTGGKGKEKQQEQDDEENTAKGGGKRYVNVRLVDFGARSKGSETGGAGIIRGDACLSMLLFESNSFDWLEPGDEEEQGKSKKKKLKVYKGGSKGAFESMHRLRHGDVVALLNPRVLKPFQRNSTSALPASANMLAVSPESAGAVLLVGRSRDFGRCNSRKKDGQQCGSWCDTRVSEVCEWHMQRAVESRRAGRAEFSAGTTGMSSSAAVRKGRKRAEEFNPEKQWGLVPNGSSNGGATYVLSGHIISSSQSSDIFVGEKMGREAQARAQRKAAGQEVEKTLKQLMERDKDGMRSVFRAREVGNAIVKEKKARKQESGKEKEKKAAKEKKEEPATQQPPVGERKSLRYSAHVIKGIGFDPAALSAASLAGARKNVEAGSTADKLQVLAKLQEAKRERGFNLKPRAGERVRSGVVAPDNDKSTEEAKQEAMVDLDDL
ncbi:hypothetical protein JOM56_014000 [Amanita muscaria]